jgi:hypothetical protein
MAWTGELPLMPSATTGESEDSIAPRRAIANAFGSRAQGDALVLLATFPLTILEDRTLGIAVGVTLGAFLLCAWLKPLKCKTAGLSRARIGQTMTASGCPMTLKRHPTRISWSIKCKLHRRVSAFRAAPAAVLFTPLARARHHLGPAVHGRIFDGINSMTTAHDGRGPGDQSISAGR